MAGCRGATPARRDAQAGKLAKVIFSASKIEIDCKGSGYILDLAVDRGLPVAYSCRAGQCGTCKVTAAGIRSRVAELGDQRPILVAARDVAGLVERPQRLRKEAVIQIELVVDNRPLVRIDVRDLVQRDRVGAVTAVLRHKFLRCGYEPLTVVGRHEPIGRPLVIRRKLGQSGGRLAGSEVGDWIIALYGQTVLGVHSRDWRIGQCGGSDEQREQANGEYLPGSREREDHHDEHLWLSPARPARPLPRARLMPGPPCRLSELFQEF